MHVCINEASRIAVRHERFALWFSAGHGYTDRSEVYQSDPSRTATLDLKNRRKPGGTAPYAEDDLGYEHDPVSAFPLPTTATFTAVQYRR